MNSRFPRARIEQSASLLALRVELSHRETRDFDRPAGRGFRVRLADSLSLSRIARWSRATRGILRLRERLRARVRMEAFALGVVGPREKNAIMRRDHRTTARVGFETHFLI